MLRISFLFLLPLALFAHSAQRTVAISEVQSSFYRGSRGPISDEEMALQLRRGAGAALEERGLALVSGASEADMTLALRFVRVEHLQPIEPAESCFCGDADDKQPVRGSLTLRATITDRQGAQIWTLEETRAYHCSVPRVEAWDLLLSVLKKAPQ